MELRPYQQAAVEAVYEHLRSKENNPCVVLPTGTGKSCVLAQIAKDAVEKWNGRVLILAHVKELLEQNADKIRKLCPELKIGIFSAGLNSRDTDEQVIVAGIQSVYDKACDLGSFDLIIIDEVHMCPFDGEGTYRTFLNDMKVINPNVRLIGLTATPFRLKGGLICKPENLLNEICYEAGLKEMIQQGYLSPLVSKAGRVEAKLDGLHIRGGEFINDEIAAAMDTESLVSSACREIVELTRDRKSVLIFTVGVAHCEHVAEKIAACSGQECALVTGNTPSGERAEIIARFKGEPVPDDFFTFKPSLKYLANVGVLTTGFDAPNTDCVVLLRPTNSAGLLVQMVGRGTRLSPKTDKTNCIAEGTPVLTDVGLIPIEKVTTKMRVWDGVEFVSHKGAVFKGVKDVITYAGLTATPNHKVCYQHHWRTFKASLEGNEPISVTECNGKAVREADGYFRRGDRIDRAGHEPQTHTGTDQMYLRRDRMEELGQSQAANRGMSDLRQKAAGSIMACSTCRLSKESLRKSERSRISRLWRSRNQVPFCKSDRNGSVLDETFQDQQNDADRQNQQQFGLCARQCSTDNIKHQSDEHSASEQNQNAKIPDETPGNPICGFNTVPFHLETDAGGRNNQTILSEIDKTQRRVWDILNAGPRHRFTAAGLLVSNCLVLDYGGNILRHGPIDMIKVKEPGAGHGGDAPAKKCPECLALIHAGYRVCPECSYEFPPNPENDRLSQTASTAGILSGQVDYSDYEVQSTYYAVHEKRGADPDAPRTMRIDYQVGFNDFKSEWVCPEHTGYARDKFIKWWRERAALGAPIPTTAGDAVAWASDGVLAEPESITVKTVTGEKFARVTGWRLKPRPSYAPPQEPGWHDGEDAPQPEDYDSDEIPF